MNNKDVKNLTSLQNKMRLAEDAMGEAMRNQWPKDTNVEVMLMHGQKNPTAGIVIAHNKNYVRVRLDTKNQHVKDIHFSDVVYP